MRSRGTTVPSALFILVLISSCGDQQPTPETASSQEQSSEAPATAGTAASANQAATLLQPTTKASTSQPTDSALSPSSPDEAVQVIHDYYYAINNGEYERAYSYWDRAGSASGQTLEQFRQGFAQTEHSNVQTSQLAKKMW